MEYLCHFLVFIFYFFASHIGKLLPDALARVLIGLSLNKHPVFHKIPFWPQNDPPYYRPNHELRVTLNKKILVKTTRIHGTGTGYRYRYRAHKTAQVLKL